MIHCQCTAIDYWVLSTDSDFKFAKCHHDGATWKSFPCLTKRSRSSKSFILANKISSWHRFDWLPGVSLLFFRLLVLELKKKIPKLSSFGQISTTGVASTISGKVCIRIRIRKRHWYLGTGSEPDRVESAHAVDVIFTYWHRVSAYLMRANVPFALFALKLRL